MQFHRSTRLLTLIALLSLMTGLLAPAVSAEAASVKGATPKISGTAKVGKTLTAKPGTWKPKGGKLSFQWYRSGKAIPGAKARTYKLVADDLGKRVTVRIEGTKKGHRSATKTSKKTTKVVAGSLVGATPTVTGKTVVGATLTAQPGTWKPKGAKLSFQWYRSGKAIQGATGGTYMLTAADAGSKLSVEVVGRLKGYATEVRGSDSTDTVLLVKVTPLPEPINDLYPTPVPTISGTVKVGATLTAVAGTWGPPPVTLSYRWLIDGSVVPGATGVNWVVPISAGGRSIAVEVTGSKPGYLGPVVKVSSAIAVKDFGSALSLGTTLRANDFMSSDDGRFQLVMQGDGNLVLYQNAPRKALWATGSSGSGNHLQLQNDGNLVVYNSAGRAVWSPNTYGKSVRQLLLQNDGNLLLYSTSGGVVWATNTAQSAPPPAGSDGFMLPFPKGSAYKITQGPAEHARGLYPDYNRHAVDFAMPVGHTVVASAAGTIAFEGYDSTGAIQVRIDHGQDRCSQYVHLSRTIVDKGHRVTRGQKIGESGNTGISTGPHLHWNMVYCSSQRSREVISTVEMGTNYAVGAMARSANG